MIKEQTNFHKQWYKYNFGELLYEYLYSEHKYVKDFFLRKYKTYNSYIRTRTKGRYNLKVIMIYQEFGIWRSMVIKEHLETPLVEWEPCRDPYTMNYIRDLSSPEAISRRRKIKRRRKRFIWMVRFYEFMLSTWSDELLVQFIRSLWVKRHARRCETRDMFTEFQSLYTGKVMNSSLMFS